MILMVFNFHTQLLRLRTYASDANEGMTNGILLIYIFFKQTAAWTVNYILEHQQMMDNEELYGN